MTVVIKDLKLALPPGGDRPYAVDGVSFELAAAVVERRAGRARELLAAVPGQTSSSKAA